MNWFWCCGLKIYLNLKLYGLRWSELPKIIERKNDSFVLRRNHSVSCWEYRDKCDQSWGRSMWWRAKFQMSVIWPTVQTPRQFLQRKVVEGPNIALPSTAALKFRIYFFKLASKIAKIGLLDDPGGQGSSPKNFKCGWGLSFGLEWSPQNVKTRNGYFWTSQWACKNRIFRL